MNKKTYVEALATFGYLGKAPKAPGTFGTLGAIPLALLFQQLGDLGYLVATILFCGFSIWVAQAYESVFETHDASEVVIDEVAGGLIAMTWVTTWQGFLLAFLLFRIFDIVKPFPVGWADKKIEGGLGVVADDILAGIIASMILQWVLIPNQLFPFPI